MQTAIPLPQALAAGYAHSYDALWFAGLDSTIGWPRSFLTRNLRK
jgi:hypothetical protein